MLQIEIKKTDEKAKLPSKGSEFSAGYDLYSLEEPITLKFGERKLFKTGIHIQIPHGYYGRVAPRSGLALKQGIDVLAGVIDSDYRGEVGVILVNLNNEDSLIDTTKPIAQLIIEKCYDADFILVEELGKTERGQGGFGSTDGKIHPKPVFPQNTLQAEGGVSVKDTLVKLYEKTGGVQIKEKYSEELKKRAE